MKLLYVTDLHGSLWKYDRLLATAQTCGAEMVVNGGDLLPNSGDSFIEQPRFIKEVLDAHFAAFDAAGIHYLCYPGNADFFCFDELFDVPCAGHPFIARHSLQESASPAIVTRKRLVHPLTWPLEADREAIIGPPVSGGADARSLLNLSEKELRPAPMAQTIPKKRRIAERPISAIRRNRSQVTGTFRSVMPLVRSRFATR